jgi:hypothetical protein
MERTVLARRDLEKRGWLARWALPVGAIVLAIPLTKLAYDTGFDLREQNPCATGWDNAWSVLSGMTLWVALISSVAVLIFAIRARREIEASLGFVAVTFILALSVACWIFANGGYGWRC